MSLPSSVYPCDICGRIYNHEVLKKCPGCAAQTASDNARKKTTTVVTSNGESSSSVTVSSDPQVVDLLKSLVNETRRNNAAINRTTLAVRSMVSFAVIILIAALAGGAFIWLGMYSWPGFTIIGALAILCGYVGAIVTLIREWAASKVDF